LGPGTSDTVGVVNDSSIWTEIPYSVGARILGLSGRTCCVEQRPIETDPNKRDAKSHEGITYLIFRTKSDLSFICAGSFFYMKGEKLNNTVFFLYMCVLTRHNGGPPGGTSGGGDPPGGLEGGTSGLAAGGFGDDTSASIRSRARTTLD
jgi:hypothetical protein